MSSILKALKKLEQEKAARTPGSLAIDSEILRDSAGRRPVSATIFKGILPAALVFICGCVATYMYLNGSNRTLKKDPVSSVAKIEKAIVAEVPVIAAPQNRPDENIVKERSVAAVQPKKLEAPSPAHKKLKVKKSLPTAAPATVGNSPTAPVQPPDIPKTIPLLRVNGIAFEPDGASGGNVAIINGNPVTGGASINGATVEEILKDRVRFSYKGERIEVLLGRSNK